MDDQSENPGPRTSLSYSFNSSQHYACRAYQGYHRRFVLGNKAVIDIRTGGRRHGGTLEIYFLNPNGSRCTAQEWADSTAYEKIEPGLITGDGDAYIKSQLRIKLSSFGKSHSASATITPLQREDGTTMNGIDEPERWMDCCGLTHINLHPSFNVRACSRLESESDDSQDSLFQSESTDALPCAICLDVLDELDESIDIVVTNCGHTFHRRCLQGWNGVTSSCPVCRRRIPWV